MKKWFFLSIIVTVLFACSSKSKKEQQINKIDIPISFAFFHDALFTAKVNDLPKLKQKYPYMFPQQMSDELTLKRMNDTTQQFLYKEVKKYSPILKIKNKIF